MIVTPDGRLSQYFYGIDYPTRDLRLALVEASQGKIGNLVDQVLLHVLPLRPTDRPLRRGDTCDSSAAPVYSPCWRLLDISRSSLHANAAREAELASEALSGTSSTRQLC